MNLLFFFSLRLYRVYNNNSGVDSEMSCALDMAYSNELGILSPIFALIRGMNSRHVCVYVFCGLSWPTVAARAGQLLYPLKFTGCLFVIEMNIYPYFIVAVSAVRLILIALGASSATVRMLLKNCNFIKMAVVPF